MVPPEKTNRKERLLWGALGVAALLAGAQALALAAGSPLIFPPPLLAARQLAVLVQKPSFWAALAFSFARLLAGLAVSVPLGIAAGLAAGLSGKVRALLAPFFTVVSATPVMAVILIAYLALGSEQTPVFTVFLMLFPVMAANTMQGVASADPALKELCAVYRLSRAERLRVLYLPALLPFIAAGLRSGLSLGWKVVVAAEVLVQPALGLGTGMQNAKAHLETPELFAWTLAAVLAAALTEGVFSVILKHKK